MSPDVCLFCSRVLRKSVVGHTNNLLRTVLSHPIPLNRLLKLFCIYVLAATAAVEGKMSKSLKKILKKIVAKDIHQELAVADAKLGGVIKVMYILHVGLSTFMIRRYLVISCSTKRVN